MLRRNIFYGGKDIGMFLGHIGLTYFGKIKPLTLPKTNELY